MSIQKSKNITDKNWGIFQLQPITFDMKGIQGLVRRWSLNKNNRQNGISFTGEEKKGAFLVVALVVVAVGGYYYYIKKQEKK